MRFISDNGRTATVIAYTQKSGTAGTDTYGDPVYGTATNVVNAVYDRKSRALTKDASGVITQHIADVYMDSTVSVDGADSTRPSDIILDGATYTVTHKDKQQDVIACECELAND